MVCGVAQEQLDKEFKLMWAALSAVTPRARSVKRCELLSAAPGSFPPEAPVPKVTTTRASSAPATASCATNCTRNAAPAR